MSTPAWDRVEKAIEQAVDHADRKAPGWRDRALDSLRTYLDNQRHKTDCVFMVQDFREWALENGLDAPPDPRSFGGVIRTAEAANLVRRFGIEMDNWGSTKKQWIPV